MSESTPSPIYDDDRADEIFTHLYLTPDRQYRPERDFEVYNACVGKLRDLGYSEAEAREFLDEFIAQCDSN